jgi:FG-GAP repeat
MKSSHWGIWTVSAVLVMAAAGCAAPPHRSAPTKPRKVAAASAPVTSSAWCPASEDTSGLGQSDIDEDGENDYAVGVSGTTDYNGGHGAVETRLSRTGAQRIYDGSFGAPADVSNRDAWGNAIAIADLNHDGCADVIVGSPRPHVTGVTDHAGHVTIAQGTPNGVASDHFENLNSPGTGDDEFGFAVAAVHSDGTGPALVWVGAPDTTVNGVPDAGAVYEYLIDGASAPTLIRTITEASSSIGLTPAADDRFGQILSASLDGGLAVGVPRRAVDGQAGAGVVVRLSGSFDAHAALTGQVISQDTPGVVGTPEAGDRFGASVAGGGRIVGAPDEDVGSVKDAGSVQTFTIDTQTSLLAARSGWTMNSAALPGRASSGAKFGYAVADGVGVSCILGQSFIVGAPGLSQGSAKAAGGVIYLPTSNTHVHCPGALLEQGDGLPGGPESGDRVGAALSIVPDTAPADDGEADTLLIGSPGESVGGQKNAGRVYLVPGTGQEGASTKPPVIIYPFFGPQQDMHFGTVLSHVSSF